MYKVSSTGYVADDRAPATLFMETPHFIIRTISVDDVAENWCDWLTDPTAQVNLNASPKRLAIEDVRKYVGAFNRVTSHINGIFAKEDQQLIGIRVAYANYERSEALLNTLIGEASARGRGANHETRYAMHNFVFEQLDLSSAVAFVVDDNAYMMRLLSSTGWVLEHTAQKPRASGAGFVPLHQFRLSRDAWRATEAAKAKAYLAGYA